MKAVASGQWLVDSPVATANQAAQRRHEVSPVRKRREKWEIFAGAAERRDLYSQNLEAPGRRL